MGKGKGHREGPRRYHHFTIPSLPSFIASQSPTFLWPVSSSLRRVPPSSVSSRSASCRLSSFVHPLRVSFTPIPFAAQRPGPGPVPSGPGPGVPPAGSE